MVELETLDGVLIECPYTLSAKATKSTQSNKSNKSNKSKSECSKNYFKFNYSSRLVMLALNYVQDSDQFARHITNKTDLVHVFDILSHFQLDWSLPGLERLKHTFHFSCEWILICTGTPRVSKKTGLTKYDGAISLALFNNLPHKTEEFKNYVYKNIDRTIQHNLFQQVVDLVGRISENIIFGSRDTLINAIIARKGSKAGLYQQKLDYLLENLRESGYVYMMGEGLSFQE